MACNLKSKEALDRKLASSRVWRSLFPLGKDAFVDRGVPCMGNDRSPGYFKPGAVPFFPSQEDSSTNQQQLARHSQRLSDPRSVPAAASSLGLYRVKLKQQIHACLYCCTQGVVVD